MSEINEMSLVERVARAITVADGVDPDKIGYGYGRIMPKNMSYPLWQARVKQAQAAIGAIIDEAPR